MTQPRTPLNEKERAHFLSPSTVLPLSTYHANLFV